MADQQWTVVRDRHNHWGMVEVEGPALTIRGFTQATDVDAVRARKVEEDAYKIAAVPELYEALDQLLTDMLIAHGNMRDAAKHDPRWEGCAEAIQPRVDAARAALAKARGEKP